MTKNKKDETYMRIALELAEKARGRTSPNPMVGALVVKGDKIISSGYHRKAGEPHAEAVALKKAGRAARDATLYVTLEPCMHTSKRTPPCTPLVIESGIKRVVTAMIDPNPQVSGGGVKALMKAGISVTSGVLESKAQKLNEAFIKHVTTGMPFVTLKIAQTLDGKIATATGESKWITGEEARRQGHRLRNENDAILVGINTVLNDDPSLTTRIPGGRDPVRVVVDSALRIPLKAKILTQKSTAPTYVATLPGVPKRKINQVLKAGVDLLIGESSLNRVDLENLMKMLGRMGITSVLIEGGSEIHASALKAGIVDKVVLFIAPLLMTGKDSLCSIGGISPERLTHTIGLKNMTAGFLGPDLMIEGYLR